MDYTTYRFCRLGDESFDGHVGVESLGFGTEMTEVVVESQGYGYIPPVEIYVVDGRPQPSDANFFGGFFGPVAEHPFLDLNQVYREAQFEVNATDENGSILDLRIVDGGEGYEPTFVDFFTGAISNTSGLARIVCHRRRGEWRSYFW